MGLLGQRSLGLLSGAIFVLLLGSAAAAATDTVVRLSEPVTSDATSETFGSVVSADLPALSLTELLHTPGQWLGKQVQVNTTIAKVCQKKGCFFIASEPGIAVRVAFRDYGFFIPTDASGKQVSLAGELIQKQLSPEQAEHFNADLQAPANTLAAGPVYEIVADGITIPR